MGDELATLKRQNVDSNTQANESANTQIQQLNSKVVYLEGQNTNFVNEVHALREAQADMEERHTAEVIQLKQSQLEAVKQTVPEFGGGTESNDEDRQMLQNLVKVKDEEIK